MTATQVPTIPVFDGHNDTILSMRETGRSFFEESATGHVDLPRAKRGGMMGGFFAVWVPDPEVALDDDDGDLDPGNSPYSSAETMPPRMTTAHAQVQALASFGHLLRIARESEGKIRIIRSGDDLRAAVRDGAFAMELHIEGAEPIADNLDGLDVFHAAGLRSIGLVWSRPNAFGNGVPFQFPSSPDTGPGLTDAGKALVRRCNELGIIVDVSHLNEKGFWDVAKTSNAPIVATHCGAHALCPSARNLTDRQLDAIRDSDGIVGVNFHVGFLHPEGNRDPNETSVKILADHVAYIAERIGIDRVALGSDFDGAVMPGDLGDASGLPVLMNELRSRGFDDAALTKIGWENWARIFDLSWKQA